MKIIKSIFIILLSIIAFISVIAVGVLLKFKLSTRRNVNKLSGDAPLLEVDGMVFRDLNGNGRLDIESLPYKEPVRLREMAANKDWELWDKQLEANSESGKLDFLIEEALQAKSNNILQEL